MSEVATKKRTPVKRWIILAMILLGIYAAFIGPSILKPLSPTIILPAEEVGLSIGGFHITNTIIATLLTDFLVLLMGIGAIRFARSGKLVPDGFYNAFEAIVGAIYLDGGLEAVRDFVRRTFGTLLEEAKTNYRLLTDAKTRLQEVMLALFRRSPVYEVVEERGPDHAKIFVIHLRMNDRTLACGKGTSKKEAEQDAAEQFLKQLEKNPLGLR